MSDFTAYFNGEWVPEDQVVIRHTDRGFVTGDVVFDVERTFNGKSFRMKEHVDRLYRSLKFVRIDPGLSDDEMLEISEEAISRNEHLRAPGGDFNIRQFVTRGPGRSTKDAGPATVGVTVSPIYFARYAGMYDSGAHAVVARTRSYASDALDPKVKHYSRMNFNMADLEATDVDEVAWPILMDTVGNLTEGTGYNFFLVTDGVIRTPGDETLLQGISRGAVFDIARPARHPIRGGGAPALRSVHRRRGLLLQHQLLHAAHNRGRQARDRGREARPRHSTAPGRVERDGGGRHRGPGGTGSKEPVGEVRHARQGTADRRVRLRCQPDAADTARGVRDGAPGRKGH